MTDGPDNIVLEHLRAIRTDMSKFAGRMDAIQAEITAVRLQLIASHSKGVRDDAN
jgi:hypothetical protein